MSGYSTVKPLWPKRSRKKLSPTMSGLRVVSPFSGMVRKQSASQAVSSRPSGPRVIPSSRITAT